MGVAERWRTGVGEGVAEVTGVGTERIGGRDGEASEARVVGEATPTARVGVMAAAVVIALTPVISSGEMAGTTIALRITGGEETLLTVPRVISGRSSTSVFFPFPAESPVAPSLAMKASSEKSRDVRRLLREFFDRQNRNPAMAMRTTRNTPTRAPINATGGLFEAPPSPTARAVELDDGEEAPVDGSGREFDPELTRPGDGATSEFDEKGMDGMPDADDVDAASPGDAIPIPDVAAGPDDDDAPGEDDGGGVAMTMEMEKDLGLERDSGKAMAKAREKERAAGLSRGSDGGNVGRITHRNCD
ncbi:hypothetical protein BC829DRAFT_389350 [Chytridium lagenaria]|nr:hypothetical protein BC829DRAFT_389350 [Chytridium lagenaria]